MTNCHGCQELFVTATGYDVPRSQQAAAENEHGSDVSVDDMTTSSWLPLPEIRREQRRVGALMQQDANVLVPKGRRKRRGVTRTYCICSRLDPKGIYRDPALDYLQQGLKNAGIKQRRSNSSPPNRENENYISLKEWKSMNNLNDFVSSQTSHWLNRHGYSRFARNRKSLASSVHYDGMPNKDDIEQFEYSNLRRKQSVKLPALTRHGDGQMLHYGERFLRSTQVPYNTPSGTLLSMKSHGQLAVKQPLPEINKKGNFKDKEHKLSKNSLSHLEKNLRRNRKSLISHVALSMHSDSAMDMPLHEDTQRHERRRRTLAINDDPRLSYRHSVVSSQGYCVCPQPGIATSERDVNDDEATTCTNDGELEDALSLMPSTRCLLCGGMVNKKNDCTGHAVTADSGYREETYSSCGSSVSDVSELRHHFARRDLTSGVSDWSGLTPEVKPLLSRENSNLSAPASSGSRAELRKRPEWRSSVSFDRLPAIGDVDKDDFIQDSRVAEIAAYQEKLDELAQRLEQGDFDFASQSDVNDQTIGTNLYLQQKEEKPQDKTVPQNKKKFALKTETRTIYPNGSKEAYTKALAHAQMPRQPPEPWMLSQRISKPYAFSYFDPGKQHCSRDWRFPVPPTSKEIKQKTTAKTGKKFNEVRHIFGNINVNDFFPGGKRNLRPTAREQTE